MNSQPPSPSGATLLAMTRPGFLSITAAATVLGIASAAACGCGLSWPKALATVVLAVLAHAAANVWNDYHDALNGADAANTQALYPFSGGSRLIQNGVVTPAQTRQLALALTLLVVPAGVLLAAYSGGGLLLIGLAGLALGWAYSAPPLKLMSRGLGELAVGAAWWLVVVGADYVQRGQFMLIPSVTAIGFALLVANILLINGLPDAPSDAQVGKRTLAVRLGPQRMALAYLTIALLAHGVLALAMVLQVAPGVAWWGLLSLPLSLAATVLLWQRRHQAQRLLPAMGLSIAAASVHALALAAGFATLAWQHLAH